MDTQSKPRKPAFFAYSSDVETYASYASSPLEGNWFHDYFRQLPFQALGRLMRRNSIDLANKRVHVAGCGRGTDLLYLSRLGKPRFCVTDISPDAVAIAMRNFPGIDGQVEDMQHLSFDDNAFDWSFVAAALHHLPRPAQGLYELLRVSRAGLIFIEPNDTWLVKLFVALGLAREYEDVGNYVYRWSNAEIHKLCKSLSYSCDLTTLFAVHRVAKTGAEFKALRILNRAANILIPRLGNYVVCCIRKNAGHRH
jgi:SAM-dependent methyltransferase